MIYPSMLNSNLKKTDKVTHNWCRVKFNINNSVLILVQCCHIPSRESSFLHSCWSEGLKGEKVRSQIQMNTMRLLLLARGHVRCCTYIALGKRPRQPKNYSRKTKNLKWPCSLQKAKQNSEGSIREVKRSSVPHVNLTLSYWVTGHWIFILSVYSDITLHSHSPK